MTTLSLRLTAATAAPSTSIGAELRRTTGLWLARARQRRELAELSDGQLDDIGISREQALCEAAKPFWRA